MSKSRKWGWVGRSHNVVCLLFFDFCGKKQKMLTKAGKSWGEWVVAPKKAIVMGVWHAKEDGWGRRGMSEEAEDGGEG